MEILQITPLNEIRYFNQEDLDTLLPILLTITSKTSSEVNALKNQINFFQNQPGKAQALEQRINGLLQKWSDKMRRLGGHPTNIFEVQFPKDETNAFFLWKYPNDIFEEF